MSHYPESSNRETTTPGQLALLELTQAVEERDDLRSKVDRIKWALRRSWPSPHDFSLFIRDVLRDEL